MIRDFSEEKRKELYDALEIVDNKEWKPFMAWCGGRAGEFGVWADRLGISSYTRWIDDYQNRILDTNNSTRNQIDTIFENVAEVDCRYMKIFQTYEKTVKNQIAIIDRMIEYINPSLGKSVIPDCQSRNLEYSKVHEFDEQDQKKLQEFLKMKISTSGTRFRVLKVMSSEDESNSENDKFIDAICTQYGFDKQTVQTMKTLYENLEEEFGEDAPQMFFALMASISYGSVEGTKNAILWGIIGGLPPTELYGYKIFESYGITEEEYNRLRSQVQIQHILCEMPDASTEDNIKDNEALNAYLNAETESKLGISFEELPEEIRQQFYKSYLNYCNTPDFTHMSATIATILNDADGKELGNFAGVYNGIYSVDGNAGYVGDVYGTNGSRPSMGNADYMADLDAVNIANRIENGNDMIDAVSEYYTELENGKTNRAREFKYNIGEGYEDIGLYILVQEAMDNFEYLEEENITEDMDIRKDTVSRFFISIINDYNYYYEE